MVTHRAGVPYTAASERASGRQGPAAPLCLRPGLAYSKHSIKCLTNFHRREEETEAQGNRTCPLPPWESEEIYHERAQTAHRIPPPESGPGQSSRKGFLQWVT